MTKDYGMMDLLEDLVNVWGVFHCLVWDTSIRVDLLEDLVDVWGVCHIGNTSVGVDLLEDLVDVQGVCHCLVGNTSVRVDLLEVLADVRRVCLFTILAVLTLPVAGPSITQKDWE
jgi:hypothetical protein